MLADLTAERLGQAPSPAPRNALDRALDPGNERPRLHPDSEVVVFTTRWGERYGVGHSAHGDNYLRMEGADAEQVMALDGRHTVADIVASRIESGGDGSRLVELLTLVREQGFLESPPLDVYTAVGIRLEPRRSQVLGAMWRGLRSQTIAFRGIDGVLAIFYRRGGRLLFARWAVGLSAVIIAVGLVAFWSTTGEAGNTIFGRLSAAGALSFIALQLIVITIHELGHALAVKHRGRRVRRAGFQLYLGNPACFVDSTDLVLEPPKARAVNAIAGPYAQAVAASMAALVAWSAPGTTLGTMAFRLAGLSYLSVLINVIPFIELDGYWLLSDLLEVPGLRSRATAVLRYEIPARLTRRRGPLTRAERWLATFAVVALLTTAGALLLAWALWAPIGSAVVRTLWHEGVGGRLVLAILLALVLGPLIHAGGGAIRSGFRRVATMVANLRFRLESSWRVEAAEAVAQLPFLDDVDEEALADLAGRVIRRRVRPGDVIVRAGTVADAFYVVRRGRFDVIETSLAGAERVLGGAGPGDAFGELALMERRPRTATVRAAEPGELFVVDGGSFLRLLAPAASPRDLKTTVEMVVEVWTLPPFRHLDQAQATELMQAGSWVSVEPGVEVVRQGDPADAFYAIATGQAEVVVDGDPVLQLRSGDHFGEIALLRHSARTATVRSLTPMRLFRIRDDLFHDLVSATLARATRRPAPALRPEVH